MREGKTVSRGGAKICSVEDPTGGIIGGCGEMDSKGIPEKFAEVNCKM